MEPSSPSTAAAAAPADTPSPAARRRALVVLGMHRSGTSAVAGVLQRIGVDFGPRLMPATAANERGYYEHIDVVNLHDRLLMALDRGWDSVMPWPPGWWEDEARTGRFRAELLALLRRDFGAAPLWGVKDPRLCLLLPWWRPLWAMLDTEPLFVIVVRDPREVAVSLGRREGISPQKSWALWGEHLLAAERETRGCERHFLRYEDFLHGWEASLAPLERHLGTAWRDRLGAARGTVSEFLDGSLRRAAAPTQEEDVLPPWLENAAGALAAACAPGEEAWLARSLDAISEQKDRGAALNVMPAERRLADLAIELAAARKLARWYEAEWHKAKARAGKAATSSNREAKERLPPPNCIITNARTLSNTRIQFIAFVRKTGAFLVGIWRRLQGS